VILSECESIKRKRYYQFCRPLLVAPLSWEQSMFSSSTFYIDLPLQALYQFYKIMNCWSCFSSPGKVSGSPQKKQSVSNNSAKRQALPHNSEQNNLAMFNANIITRPLEEGDYNKGKHRMQRSHLYCLVNQQKFSYLTKT
jgi:hypothetical protein